MPGCRPSTTSTFESTAARSAGAYIGVMSGVETTVIERGDFVVLHLRGRANAATVLRLQTLIAELLRRPRPRLVVSLAEIAECDSTAATMFAVTSAIATECGGELRMASPNGCVTRALWAAGAMQTYGTVEGALRGDVHDLLQQHAPRVTHAQERRAVMSAEV